MPPVKKSKHIKYVGVSVSLSEEYDTPLSLAYKFHCAMGMMCAVVGGETFTYLSTTFTIRRVERNGLADKATGRHYTITHRTIVEFVLDNTTLSKSQLFTKTPHFDLLYVSPRFQVRANDLPARLMVEDGSSMSEEYYDCFVEGLRQITLPFDIAEEQCLNKHCLEVFEERSREEIRDAIPNLVPDHLLVDLQAGTLDDADIDAVGDLVLKYFSLLGRCTFVKMADVLLDAKFTNRVISRETCWKLLGVKNAHTDVRACKTNNNGTEPIVYLADVVGEYACLIMGVK